MQNKRKLYKKIVITVFVFIFLFLFCYYENHHLVVSQYIYESEKVSSTLDGFRIVQISDFHNAKFGKKNSLLIKKIKDEKPDLIVLTGDLIDSNHTNIEIALSFISEIVDICPVFYITGNHEYWLDEKDYRYLCDEMGKKGVQILINEELDINYKSESFVLIGLDDKALSDGTLNELTKLHKEQKLTVLLAHEPQYLDNYSKSNVDLVLSGHAHGGQFRLPFIGGVVAPDQGFNPMYTEGLHELGNTKMIVSRGLGNSIIPVRLFNDPEIVTVVLSAKESE